MRLAPEGIDSAAFRRNLFGGRGNPVYPFPTVGHAAAYIPDIVAQKSERSIFEKMQAQMDDLVCKTKTTLRPVKAFYGCLKKVADLRKCDLMPACQSLSLIVDVKVRTVLGG